MWMPLQVTYKEKSYSIEYSETDDVLIFRDKEGATIGFVKDNVKHGLGVYVSDEYSNPKMWDEHPNLKGTNGYMLAPEQVAILLKWYNEEIK